MEDHILRKYPTLKYERFRYTKEDFEKYKEITNSIENYEKWKIGINYKTSRKIKIGGKSIFNLDMKTFTLNTKHHYIVIHIYYLLNSMI